MTVDMVGVEVVVVLVGVVGVEVLVGSSTLRTVRETSSLKCGGFFFSLIIVQRQIPNINYELINWMNITSVIGPVGSEVIGSGVPQSFVTTLLLFCWRKNQEELSSVFCR